MMHRRNLMSAGSALLVQDVFSSDYGVGTAGAQSFNIGVDLLNEGGMIWAKSQFTVGTHSIVDSERGPTAMSGSTYLGEHYPNATTAALDTDDLDAYTATGFTLRSSTGTMNSTGVGYAFWTFAKAARFFDIVTYTGDGASNRAIAHSLGVTPGLIIIKRTDAATNWVVGHNYDFTKDFRLNLSDAAATNSIFNGSDASNFRVNASATPSRDVNQSGGSYVAYIFAHDSTAPGVISCGSYTGNGSTTGPVVTLGWEPQFLIVKRADVAGDWIMLESYRDGTNPRSAALYANTTAAEFSGFDTDFLSTGFQPKVATAGINASGGTYIYMAIRAV